MKTPLAAFAFFVLAALATAQEYGYDHGRVRFTEGGVTLQRATDTGAEEAQFNSPFLPGDRMWTDGSGRGEFQLPDGALLRLDRRSKLDYIAHDGEGRDETIAVRLWSGSLILRLPGDAGRSRLEVETPGGLVTVEGRAVVRIDAEAAETRVAVYEGDAVLDAARRRQEIGAGEAVYVRRGEWPDEPRRFDRDGLDDFGAWDRARAEGEWDRRESSSARFLPSEVRTYAADFDRYGSWHYETEVGYVWAPRVEVGWRPYWNGRWAWTAYGWNWVPYEPWGFAPSHYGRWGFSAGLGWYWAPGGAWSPAWVSWAWGGDTFGWCPLGYRNRPVTGLGYAVPRGTGAGSQASAWTFARRSDLGARDLARRRLSADAVQVRSLQVADSARLRPTRDLRAVEAAPAVPRGSRARAATGESGGVETGRAPSRAVPWPGAVARDREREERARSRDDAAPRHDRSGREADRSRAGAREGSSLPWDWPEGAAARRAPAPPVGTESRPSSSGRSRTEDEGRGDRPSAAPPSEQARPRHHEPDRDVMRQLFNPLTEPRGSAPRPRGGEGASRPREERPAPPRGAERGRSEGSERRAQPPPPRAEPRPESRPQPQSQPRSQPRGGDAERRKPPRPD